MQSSNASGKSPVPTSPDRNQNTSDTEQASSSSANATTTTVSFVTASVGNNLDTLATVASASSIEPSTSASNLDILATAAAMSERLPIAQEQTPSTSGATVTRQSVIRHSRMHPYQLQPSPEARRQAPQDHTQPAQPQAASLSLLHALLTASSVRPHSSSDSSSSPHPQQQTSILRTLLEPTFSRPQLAQASTSLAPRGLNQETSYPTGYFKRPKELDPPTSAQREQSIQAVEASHLRYRQLPDSLKNLHPSQLPPRFRLPYIPNFYVLPPDTEQPQSMDALKALIWQRLRAGVGRQLLSYELEYRFPNMSWHPSPGQIDAIAKEAARIEGKGKGKGKRKNRQDNT